MARDQALAAPPKVEVNASHRYGALVVHEQIRFKVAANEFLCICGPSGCGKSTLLDMLAGILRPTGGSVLIDGRPADPKRQSISFVFQEPSTFPWLNVRDNVATGLRIKGTPRAEVDAKVSETLRLVGLNGFENYYPHQISGGMKQRVAIARAFATDADLILMDEPFVSLDQPTRERMQGEVLDIWRHRRRTVIFVTHNIEEAIFLGDRIVTGPAGGLQIMLLDGTTFSVGPNSSMVIDEFVYNPSTGTGKLTASVARGTLRLISGRLGRQDEEAIKIKLPVATVGVRGTMSIFSGGPNGWFTGLFGIGQRRHERRRRPLHALGHHVGGRPPRAQRRPDRGQHRPERQRQLHPERHHGKPQRDGGADAAAGDYKNADAG